ncbi:MAG: DNA-processing protein DprA [Clostridia bacterium]|nr:DNA-processing protein DprA [Clostridia bacterium]
MDKIDKAVVFLDSFDFATYKKKQKVLELIKNPEDLLDAEKLQQNKSELLNIFSNDEYIILLNGVKNNNLNLIEKSLNMLKINAISIFSSLYPLSLKNIDTPPLVIYYKGDISLLKTNCFAIVGSRHITNYGKVVTEKFAKELSLSNFTIVSGLAAGVDTVAHKSTLTNAGKTIAVLAGGLDEIYPSSNTTLANDIVASGGLLISETRPHKKADMYMFPIRNRIISAISKGILITEAQEKSGVIHTKNYALEYGKDVFAVPGNITSIASVGANRMIANGQAKAVTSLQDILDEYNMVCVQKKQKTENYSMLDMLVVDCLKQGPRTFQELVDLTKLEAKTLNSLLTTLLIRGIIKKLAGNVYHLI